MHFAEEEQRAAGFLAIDGWWSTDLLTEFRDGTHEEAMVSRLGHW